MSRNDSGWDCVQYLVLWGWLWTGSSVWAGVAPGEDLAPVRFEPEDRVMVLAPHPDDEVLGCAGVVQEAVARGLAMHVVFFTYGDDNEKSFLVYRKHPVWKPSAVERMGLIRHQEALGAARVMGLGPEHVTFLGYPDGGGLEIWQRHWNEEPAYVGQRTKARAVPYGNALRPGAAYKGEEVTRDLARAVAEFRPTRIFVSHPGDHHPDHQSLPLFLQVALWDLKLDQPPEVQYYLVHHKHWPKPFGFHPQAALDPPPGWSGLTGWRVKRVEDLAAKERALKQHRTQYEYSAPWLRSFLRQNELFGRSSEVQLAPGGAPLSLGSNAPDVAAELPEHLEEEEGEMYVGLLRHAIRWQEGELVVDIECTRPLPARARLSVFAFGYRSDKPFGEITKLQVVIEPEGHQVWDQNREVPADGVGVERRGQEFAVRIPLRVIGDPEKVFIGTQTHGEDVHLDMLPWRILDLQRRGEK